MLNALFIALVTQLTNQFMHDTTPTIHKLEVKNVVAIIPFKGREKAVLQFDFDLDLSTLFDWNCKQVFVFFEAAYTAAGRPSNRIIVWDHVIYSKEEAKHVKGQGSFSEYEMDDISHGLKGANVTFKLGVDTMPILGLVGKRYQLQYANTSNFLMPSTYGKFI